MTEEAAIPNTERSRGTPGIELLGPLRALRGVGPALEKRLQASGVQTPKDLLHILPSSYLDLRRVLPLESPELEGRVDETVVVEGRFERVVNVPTRRRSLRIVRAVIVDESGRRLDCVWFNQPYLGKRLRGDPSTYRAAGRLQRRQGRVQLLNARLAPLSEERKLVEVVYPRLTEVGPALIQRLLHPLLDVIAQDPNAIPDPLPADIRQRYGLLGRGQALLALHRPMLADELPPADSEQPTTATQAAEEAAAGATGAAGAAGVVDFERLRSGTTEGHRRLLFDRLLGFQLRMSLRSASNPHGAGREPPKKNRRYQIDERVRAKARGLFPFRLTAGQRAAVADVVADLRSDTAMLRLVQGDVGCGKTAVAAMAALVVAESGYQVAVLAPTELLAEQHAAELQAILAPHHRVALVTGGSDATQRDLSAASAPRVIVGTHALLSGDVIFDDLALVVIDEQHRFGVSQRESMVSRATRPDVLILTATPIPRSMALFLYGDLDLSTIRELPASRRPVHTKLLPIGNRERAVAELRAELQAGGQGYVVFPRIHEGEGDMPSLAALEQHYRSVLEPFRCAVVTGETPADERQHRIEQFRAGSVHCLLATTVIEVGVDVPNASFLILEGAERFGLAQLHQLRGRIGRGTRASRCIALWNDETETAADRLQAFCRTTDGFELAELDLRQRGPGQLLGTRQSGGADRLLLRAMDEERLVEIAREVADELRRRFEGVEPSRSADFWQHLTADFAPAADFGSVSGG